MKGTELAATLLDIAPAVHWIFSQTDVRSHIQRIRTGNTSLLMRWADLTCIRAEKQIFRTMPLIVTGSYSDGKRSKALGAQRIEVIPMAYDTVLPAPAADAPVDQDVYIAHLGGLETTANRIGLEAYLRKVHPSVREAAALWIIGDDSKLKEPLKTLLYEANADLKGFVPDLGEVLRPFNIAILPYEHDSGYRTKLPVLFNYAQVVVTTEAAVAGMWIDGLDHVCVVLDSLEDFPAALLRLIDQPDERERLGRAAHAFFADHFTLDAVLDRYRAIMRSLLD